MTNLNALTQPVSAPTPKGKPRVLTLDIETSPHLAFTYSLWDTNIQPDMVVEPSRVLCFAAKYLDEKKTHFYSEYHDGHEQMIAEAWHLLNEADIVVTYNGIGFDEKHLAREFLQAGYNPPSPYQSIDLLRTVRGRFKFPSNRLGQVGDNLNIGTKLQHEGWALWQAVLNGDDKAWAKFKRYNIQDVRLTEDLLIALGPWIKGLPHAGLWNGNLHSCYACGSSNLQHNGIAHTRTSIYPRYECHDCGAWNKTLRNGQTRAA